MILLFLQAWLSIKFNVKIRQLYYQSYQHVGTMLFPFLRNFTADLKITSNEIT